MRYEVRCCCKPTKLLGWITLNEVTPGRRRVKFAAPIELLLPGPFGAASEDARVEVKERPAIELELAIFSPGFGRPTYRAFKAEGVSTEELKRIPQFEEAT